MVLDGNAVRSVDRAAALLLALGDSQGEAGVTELADQEVGESGAVVRGLGVVGQDDDAAVGIGPPDIERSRGPRGAVTDDRVPGGQRPSSSAPLRTT